MAGMWLMSVPDLFLILQEFCSKVTELLVLVMQPMETIVSTISGV
jgi:hypothetical protein